MSDDRKKAFWFIALLSMLVILPFLGETIFYSKGEPREAIVAFSMAAQIARCRVQNYWSRWQSVVLLGSR